MEDSDHEHPHGVVHGDNQDFHIQYWSRGLPIHHLLVFSEQFKVDERESLNVDHRQLKYSYSIGDLLIQFLIIKLIFDCPAKPIMD